MAESVKSQNLKKNELKTNKKQKLNSAQFSADKKNQKQTKSDELVEELEVQEIMDELGLEKQELDSNVDLEVNKEYSEEKEVYELTVKDFYEKALNNEIENDSKASGFRYTIDNIGDSMGTYGEYVDAVYFENGKIIVRYKNGGV